MREEPGEREVPRDVLQESFDALRALGHSESDARRLIDSVLQSKKKYKTVEEVLQAIYEQVHKT
jgi:Holliday junction DNA helicase RuvA